MGYIYCYVFFLFKFHHKIDDLINSGIYIHKSARLYMYWLRCLHTVSYRTTIGKNT